MGNLLSNTWIAPRNAQECLMTNHLKVNSNTYTESLDTFKEVKASIKQRLIDKEIPVGKDEWLNEHLIIFKCAKITYEILQILKPSIEDNLSVLVYYGYSMLRLGGQSQQLHLSDFKAIDANWHETNYMICYVTSDQIIEFLKYYDKPHVQRTLSDNLQKILQLAIAIETPTVYEWKGTLPKFALRNLMYKFNNFNIYQIKLLDKILVPKDIFPNVDECYKSLYNIIDEMKEDVVCVNSEKTSFSKIIYVPATEEMIKQVILYDDLLQLQRLSRAKLLDASSLTLLKETAIVPQFTQTEGQKNQEESENQEGQQIEGQQIEGQKEEGAV